MHMHKALRCGYGLEPWCTPKFLGLELGCQLRIHASFLLPGTFLIAALGIKGTGAKRAGEAQPLAVPGDPVAEATG